VAVAWIFVVIVFTLTVTVVKYKLNQLKSAVMVVDEKLELKVLIREDTTSMLLSCRELDVHLANLKN